MRLESYLTESVYDPSIFKAIFMAGGPGSGKSYVANRTTLGHGMKIINSDTMFEKYMERAGKELDQLDITPEEFKEVTKLHNLARVITKKQKLQYINGRLGLVIDGTGRRYEVLARQRKELDGLGYDTYMIFVNTSLEVAQERNMERKRKLPPAFVEDAWTAVQGNMGKYQNLFGSQNFIVVDNNDAGDDVFKKVWKQAKKLIKSPIKNPLGNFWISTELEKKKRLY